MIMPNGREVFNQFLTLSFIYWTFLGTYTQFSLEQNGIQLVVIYPGWNCLNFLHVFVGYKGNFPWFYKILKEMSMHSACYLANGDYIRYLHKKLTRKNKVIAAVKKWKCFQF